MRSPIILLAVLAACSPAESEGHPHRQPARDGDYATQVDAPAPDYVKLTKVPYLKGE